ncbi:MAG: hypothetical protein JSR33_02705 [Proteobacteria bacterium]|nr:hypothetical protein [Pseudomonadota bacterium]
MHFDFFSPAKDKSDLDTKSSQPSRSQEAVQFSETKPEGVEIFGKSYSFRGADKPVLCTLRAEPLKNKENTYFILSYVEADESIQAIRLSVEIQESNRISLGLSAIKELKLADFFEKLSQQAQASSVSLQIKSTDFTYLYYLQGESENIKQLFPLLRNLMENRFCNYGKEYILTPPVYFI